MNWLFALALALGIHDVDGVERQPMKAAKGHPAALFFIAPDCPVSNYYSREIRRICEDFGKRGLSCSLVYVDPTLTDAVAKKHAADYGHGDYAKIVDHNHELVKAAGATITPEAVLLREDGTTAYRGRIDNYYAALGKPRRIVTEHNLRDALEAVFTGQKVAVPETKAVGCYIPDLAAYR